MGARDIAAVRSSAVAALGLTGGFLAGRLTGRRDVGGALFAAAGAWCVRVHMVPGNVDAVRVATRWRQESSTDAR